MPAPAPEGNHLVHFDNVFAVVQVFLDRGLYLGFLLGSEAH